MRSSTWGTTGPKNSQRVIGILESELKLKAEQHLLPIQPGDVPATYADIGRARDQAGF